MVVQDLEAVAACLTEGPAVLENVQMEAEAAALEAVEVTLELLW
jgi:hypothetical protein